MKLPIFHPIVKEEDDEKDKIRKKDEDKELRGRKTKKEYSSQLSSGFHLSCLFPVSPYRSSRHLSDPQHSFLSVPFHSRSQLPLHFSQASSSPNIQPPSL
jgi:hypothetical protein